MYDETILPVHSKFRIPSRSQARLYFVQDETKNSLFFIKWIELVICLLCLCFAILASNVADLLILNKTIIIVSSSSSVLLVLGEITYQYLKRSLPLVLQVLVSGINFVIYGITTMLIHQTENKHELMTTLMFLCGFTSVIFLVDFICKIIISTYLYQTTRVKSVVDVGVSACIPSPPRDRPKQSQRSALTATPITYGGTFPVGKNQPPFLPDERSGPADGYYLQEKVSRHRSVQTPQYTSKTIGGSTYDLMLDDLMHKNRRTQTSLGINDKVVPPFYLDEERRKKSPWTLSTPTSSRKIEARKQASMSTPITYSGTFAVNKELVPITPAGTSNFSPMNSPRIRKSTSRSEGSSPRRLETNVTARLENCFVELGRLDHISEEKISLENCSLSRSDMTIYDGTILPGSTFDNSPFDSNTNYDII